MCLAWFNNRGAEAGQGGVRGGYHAR